MSSILEASPIPSGSRSENPVEKSRIRLIRNDQEILEEITKLAAGFREGAIERDQKRILPAREIEQLTRSGFFGISVPKEYGGADVSAVTIGEAFRILSAADPSIGQIPQNHFCWLPIFSLGTPEQQAFFYGRILQGDRIGNAHSESTRRKPGDYEHQFERVDGGYVVTGKKYYSTGAIFAQWIPLIAKNAEGQALMLFARSDAEGLTVTNDWSGMGQRTTASGTTIFDRVFIPDEYVFPFYKSAESPRSFGPIASLIHSAVDLGIAEEALVDAKDYILTKNRPWIENPYDEHAKEPFIIKRFGELTVELHIAQIVFRHAAQQVDAYRLEPTPESSIRTRMAIADARIVCGKAALLIADELFALTGARATLEQYDLDRHWRNARTHTLHDPFRWKHFHIGNYYLNGVKPPGGSYI